MRNTPSEKPERVKNKLTEHQRNDELDEIRKMQPYTLFVLLNGDMLREKSEGMHPEDVNLILEVDENVFPPDFGITSKLITKTVISHYSNAEEIIEMGAGSGYPSIAYAASNKGSLKKLTLVDILPGAVTCAEKNVQRNRHRFPPKCEIQRL